MNFIIINPDEMRHNSLSCYGNKAAVTPNIDRLAKEGTKFSNCFVQNPVCTPSRVSFLTGLYPHNGGHRTLWNLIKKDQLNLFSYLKEDGYDIHIWGKNDAFDKEALKQSATTVNLNIPNRVENRQNQFEHSQDGYYSFLFKNILNDYKEFPDYDCVNQAIKYLETKPKNSFCIFLPLTLPHCPYRVSKDFEDVIDIEKIEELKPLKENEKVDFYRQIRRYRNLENLDQDFLRQIMKIYLSMVSVMDKMIGDLLEAVQRNGYDENTTILFFSDHGDWAGDYGLVEKWPNALDDCLLHVPLIIRAPGAKKDNIQKAPVELFDIVATILDLASIEARHTHFSKSLVNQLNGQKGDIKRTVFAEGGYDGREPHCIEGSDLPYDVPMNKEGIYYPKGKMQQEIKESACRSVMARTLEYKLVRRTNNENELYDLKKDPNELNNLYDIDEYKNIKQEMEEKLISWYIKTSDTVPFERKERGFNKEISKKLNEAYINRCNNS